MKIDIVERWCAFCEKIHDHEVKVSTMRIICQTCGTEEYTTMLEINQIFAYENYEIERDDF